MPVFFEDPEVVELAQSHAEKAGKLEESEMRRILKLYREVRQDLRDRLDVIPKGTFTEQQMRGSLMQVEAALNRMQEVLRGEMQDGTETAAASGLDQLISEISRWNKRFTGAVIPIDLDAVRVASDTSNFLFNKHEASLTAYSEDLRSSFAYELSNAVVAGVQTSEAVQRMGQLFLGEEWKLQRLVRTELHNAFNLGKINGMFDLQEEQIPDLMKTLFHPMDQRTGKDSKRLAQNNPIVPVDQEFVEDSTGKVRRYMAPPNRPNDRSILIPYRRAWEK